MTSIVIVIVTAAATAAASVNSVADGGGGGGFGTADKWLPATAEAWVGDIHGCFRCRGIEEWRILNFEFFQHKSWIRTDVQFFVRPFTLRKK